MDYYKLSDNLCSLTVYKNIAKDKIIEILSQSFSDDDNLPSLAQLVSVLTEKAEKHGFTGNLLRNYIIHLLLTDENTFTMLCENNIDVQNSSIYKLAQADIHKILEIANIDLKSLPDFKFMENAISEISDYRPVCPKSHQTEITDITIDNIIAYHSKNGCGDISKYRTFKYSDSQHKLVGIPHPDPITFDDLIGYESQTKTLIDNTEAFIKGYKANNVLLVGARGTGKSSSVKALVNKYFTQGLRLLEITKEQIILLPDILKLLKPRGRRFIIYIDDLSFDEQEIQYKYMKSILEGGSESQPDNVLFYATSNRRHLIQEKWSDRAQGSQEAEIHTTDTLNEKLSLSDRFGITITYPKPTPKEYISIVSGLAKRQGLDIDQTALEKMAMSWELNQKGMSGRTAKQFINNMIWQSQE